MYMFIHTCLYIHVYTCTSHTCTCLYIYMYIHATFLYFNVAKCDFNNTLINLIFKLPLYVDRAV